MTGTVPADSTAAAVDAIVAMVRAGVGARWSDADLREYVAGLLAQGYEQHQGEPEDRSEHCGLL